MLFNYASSFIFLQRLFNFMDIDRSGAVDLDEFADAMMAFEQMSFGFS